MIIAKFKKCGIFFVEDTALILWGKMNEKQKEIYYILDYLLSSCNRFLLYLDRKRNDGL